MWIRLVLRASSRVGHFVQFLSIGVRWRNDSNYTNAFELDKDFENICDAKRDFIDAPSCVASQCFLRPYPFNLARLNQVRHRAQGITIDFSIRI